jgi:hypothetical protein
VSDPGARSRVLSTAMVVGLLVAACTSDPPSPEDAVGILRTECQRQVGQVEALDEPETIFELETVAGRAFGILSATQGEFDARDLWAVDEPDVERYMRAGNELTNSMSELSLAAGYQDVERARAALDRTGPAQDDIDDATAELGLPEFCGARAWGGTLFERAGTVADDEVRLLEPSGDYLNDVGRYCSRYRRSADAATQPGNPVEDRRYAWSFGHSLALLRDRLDRLDPPAEHSATHDRLLEVLEEAATALEDSEALAIAEQDDELRRLVERTQARVAEVDQLLAELGADCEGELAGSTPEPAG